MTGIERFGLSPLIRFTLLSLYVALVLPPPSKPPVGEMSSTSDRSRAIPERSERYVR